MAVPKEVQTPGEFKCELWKGCQKSSVLVGKTAVSFCALQRYEVVNEHYSCFPLNFQSCGVSPGHGWAEPFLCVLCKDTVLDCSLFYSKRFCLPCVKENLKAFPLETQEDMDKRKTQQKSFKKKGYKA